MNESKKYYLTELAEFGDARGQMCVVEAERQVPFKIERLFYTFNNCSETDAGRGNHANRNSKFAFVCLAGSCEIDVDDGANKDHFVLSNPHTMLVIENMVWKEMNNFSKDSILLVLSSHRYDKAEYIRDYKGFLGEVQ